MNRQSSEDDRAEQEIMTYTFSDEALEAAAGSQGGPFHSHQSFVYDIFTCC